MTGYALKLWIVTAVLAVSATARAQETWDPPPEDPVAPPQESGDFVEPDPEPVDTTSGASPSVTAPAPRAGPAAPAPSGPPAPAPAWSRAPGFVARAPAPREETGAAADAEEEPRDVSQDRLLHGFRLGYLLTANIDAAWDPERPEEGSYRQHHELVSPHQFIFGYEVTWRMVGNEWLNVVLVGNILIAGLEQSRFFPSLNGLLGFELSKTFQIGVGVNLAPTKDRGAHMLFAAGWTPQVGGFYVPVHFFFIPDVYGHHRFGVTTGVSF
jgi:hypothetical protein